MLKMSLMRLSVALRRQLSPGYSLRAFLYSTNAPTSPSIVNVKRPERPDFLKDGQIHYEIAVPEDKKLVVDFMLDCFRPHGPFQPALQATREDVKDFYTDIIVPCLESECSLLGFEGDKLLAIQMSMFEHASMDSPELQSKDLSVPPFNYIKPDYAEDIAKGPYKSEKANIMYVFVNEVQRNWTHLFPPGAKLLNMEIAAVVPEARRRGLAWEMGYATMRLAANLGCVGGVVTPIAPAMKQLARKETGSRGIAREIFFKDFKANGKPVFGDFQGSGQIVCGTFDELMHYKG